MSMELLRILKIPSIAIKKNYIKNFDFFNKNYDQII